MQLLQTMEINHSNISLDSTSLELLKGVQILLLGFGIKSKLYKDRRAGKLKSFLPDGKGGLKEYDVREMNSLGSQDQVVTYLKAYRIYVRIKESKTII